MRGRRQQRAPARAAGLMRAGCVYCFLAPAWVVSSCSLLSLGVVMVTTRLTPKRAKVIVLFMEYSAILFNVPFVGGGDGVHLRERLIQLVACA